MPITKKTEEEIKLTLFAIGGKTNGKKIDFIDENLGIVITEKEAKLTNDELFKVIKSKMLFPCPECGGKKKGNKPCWACQGLGAMTEQDEKEYWLKP